ncbi:MAG: hypothetical protein ACXW4P_08725 [Thermoanaerobaculia bacterium]
MTKRVAAALLILTAVALPLHADFASIAPAIAAQHGVKQVWIPFLSIARLAVRMIEPEGVHDFQLATFEGADDLDPRELQNIIRTKAGAGFVPLVQVWSKKSSEWSFIYARPSAKTDRLELLILTRDSSDTVLVRVDVDANIVARELKDKPQGVTNMARR